MRVCAEVVNANCAAAAATTVSCCVAEVRPALAAVRVGMPALLSLYLKLAMLLPAVMVTLAMVVLSAVSRNKAEPEVLLRLTA